MTSPFAVHAPSNGGTALGDANDNVVLGSLFADNPDGEAGADTLDGGDGNDQLNGGAGQDSFRAELLWTGVDYEGFGADVVTIGFWVAKAMTKSILRLGRTRWREALATIRFLPISPTRF